MNWMRTPSLLLVTGVLAACSNLPGVSTSVSAAKLTSQTVSPAPLRSMLWVGNSFFYYNNSMHGHLGQLMAGAADNGKRDWPDATIRFEVEALLNKGKS